MYSGGGGGGSIAGSTPGGGGPTGGGGSGGAMPPLHRRGSIQTYMSRFSCAEQTLSSASAAVGCLEVLVMDHHPIRAARRTPSDASRDPGRQAPVSRTPNADKAIYVPEFGFA